MTFAGFDERSPYKKIVVVGRRSPTPGCGGSGLGMGGRMMTFAGFDERSPYTVIGM